ncbi:MAG TPA: radical SAM protein [Candidatus Hypogeohydataceae bacterium YC40]
MIDPYNAVLAVTQNCNSHCIMCDVWKRKREEKEMIPSDYSALPSSLRDINISGGEPFLKDELPEVIEVVKRTCPKARILISTNGLLIEKMRRSAPLLLRIDREVAIRVSIDGIGKTHDRIRGIPGSFNKAVEGIRILKDAGIRDLGIAMTVMEGNVSEIEKVYNLAEDRGVEFSISIVSDSSSLFGDRKKLLRPKKPELFLNLMYLINREYRNINPKRWFRAWFEKGLLRYALTRKRPLPCDAVEGFFYMDSFGEIYCCPVLPYSLGNLRRISWNALWNSDESRRVRGLLKGCNRCWMICTARSQTRSNLLKVGTEVLLDKFKAHLNILKFNHHEDINGE